MTAEALGPVAVALARRSLDAHLQGVADGRPGLPREFERRGAAFVTLAAYPDGGLRGCIGFPEPVLPLAETVERAALAAARDPRFPPVTPRELDAVTVEVSLLTPPRPLASASPRDRLRAVVPGRDGLAVRYGPRIGVLLPQVAVAEGWTPDEFLSQACLKAGLLPDAWFEPAVRIATFQATVFVEERPRGPVVRRLPPAHDGR